MMQIVRCTNQAHLSRGCGRDGKQIVMQPDDYHWDFVYENGQLATLYHAQCKPPSAIEGVRQLRADRKTQRQAREQKGRERRMLRNTGAALADQ